MSDLKKTIAEVFTTDELNRHARNTGFCERRSKISPMMFFDLMMYDVSSTASKSLNQLSIEAKSEHNITVSKQGLDKKFNDQFLAFLKCLIEQQLSQKLNHQIEAGWLSNFNRVNIKDGTRFNLPEEYTAMFPGSGGGGSTAGACLQFEYDLKSGQIIDLNLTAANRPDVKDATEVLDTVSGNDLVIRDLGYYAFKSLTNIAEKKAYFISRLGYKTNVFEKIDGQYIKLDFKDLYHHLKKHDLLRISKDVWIGTTAKIPVRLIIELMPDAIYEQRMRKTSKLHKKKGYQTSEEYKFMSRFNLFITNVSQSKLPNEVIPILYRVRWQVELVFKIWKSVIGIHHSRKMKFKRWLCLIHFKLLLMITNWNLILLIRNDSYCHQSRFLSLNKCFKTLFDNSHRLREALKNGLTGLNKFAGWMSAIFKQNHWLERKKNSLGLENIIHLFYCHSNIYAYI